VGDFLFLPALFLLPRPTGEEVTERVSPFVPLPLTPFPEITPVLTSFTNGISLSKGDFVVTATPPKAGRDGTVASFPPFPALVSELIF